MDYSTICNFKNLLKSPKQCFSQSGGVGWGFGQFPEHKCPWPSQSESEGGTQKSLKNLRKLPSRFKQHPFRCPARLHTWQRTALYHFIQVLPLQKLAHSAVSWGTYTRTPLWNRIQMKRFRCLERACAGLGYALSGMLWLTLNGSFQSLLKWESHLTFSRDRSCWSRI